MNNYFIVLWLLFFLLFPSQVASQSAEDWVNVQGNLQLKYELKSLSDDFGSDHRLFQTGDLLFTSEKWKHFKVVFSGDLSEDLDGKDPVEGDRSRSFLDTFDEDIHGYLYESYVDIHDLGFLKSIKAGRHYITSIFSAHIDGVSTVFELFKNRSRLFLYGGYPADLFDIYDKDTNQGGILAEFDLPVNTTVSLEFQTANEENDGNSRTSNQAAAALEQIFSVVRYSAILSSFEDELKSMEISGRYKSDMSKGLEVAVTYYLQFIEMEKMPSFHASYINLLGPILPYQQLAVYLLKEFENSSYAIFGGLDYRRLLDEDDESEFNHSFYHVYLASSIEDVFFKGLQLTIQADLWQQLNDKLNDEMILTGGGEALYEISDKAKVRVGSFYSLYQYDYYEDREETVNVYTVYSDARYVFTNHIYLTGGYELDIYDIYEHRFFFRMGYWFK